MALDREGLGRDRGTSGFGGQGRGYVGDRTDTAQQTDICLGIHRQTRLATFNPTCLSRHSYCTYAITEPVGLFALSFHFSTTMWNIC